MEESDNGKTLGTYDIAKITAVKRFIVQAPGENILGKNYKNYENLLHTLKSQSK
jgi:hypothetical protein